MVKVLFIGGLGSSTWVISCARQFKILWLWTPFSIGEINFNFNRWPSESIVSKVEVIPSYEVKGDFFDSLF